MIATCNFKTFYVLVVFCTHVKDNADNAIKCQSCLAMKSLLFTKEHSCSRSAALLSYRK